MSIVLLATVTLGQTVYTAHSLHPFSGKHDDFANAFDSALISDSDRRYILGKTLPLRALQCESQHWLVVASSPSERARSSGVSACCKTIKLYIGYIKDRGTRRNVEEQATAAVCTRDTSCRQACCIHAGTASAIQSVPSLPFEMSAFKLPLLALPTIFLKRMTASNKKIANVYPRLSCARACLRGCQTK